MFSIPHCRTSSNTNPPNLKHSSWNRHETLHSWHSCVLAHKLNRLHPTRLLTSSKLDASSHKHANDQLWSTYNKANDFYPQIAFPPQSERNLTSQLTQISLPAEIPNGSHEGDNWSKNSTKFKLAGWNRKKAKWKVTAWRVTTAMIAHGAGFERGGMKTR